MKLARSRACRPSMLINSTCLTCLRVGAAEVMLANMIATQNEVLNRMVPIRVGRSNRYLEKSGCVAAHTFSQPF